MAMTLEGIKKMLKNNSGITDSIILDVKFDNINSDEFNRGIMN